jgi:hypothetical protein
VCADLAELVHQREAAEDHEIIDTDMAGQRGRIREDAVVADDAVVRQMHVRHDPIAVADAGDTATVPLQCRDSA